MPDVAGAMHQIGRQQSIESVRFGFDSESLYVRLDPVDDASAVLARGASFVLHFVRPAGLRVACERGIDGRAIAKAWQRDGSDWAASNALGLEAAAGRILELRLPLALAGVGAERLSFFVAVEDAQAREVERHPAGRPFELPIPDGRFAALNWTA